MPDLNELRRMTGEGAPLPAFDALAMEDEGFNVDAIADHFETLEAELTNQL